MKQIFRITILFCFLGLLTEKGFSQFSTSYYSYYSRIGVGYNFNERLWGELKLYTNTFIRDVSPELVLCYNFVKKEKHNIYIGFGGSANHFKGLVLPIGIQFTPFEKFDRFSLHIEAEPMYDFDRDLEEMAILGSWGFRYTFGKK